MTAEQPLNTRVLMDPPVSALAGWVRFRTNERTATVMGHRGRREYTVGRHLITVIDRRPR